MAKLKMPDTGNKSQRERFEQAARELGVELDEEKLKEALQRIAPGVGPTKRDPRSGGAKVD